MGRQFGVYLCSPLPKKATLSRENCVQYRESDFHFLSRLMEEAGIFYFLQHDDDVHTLVLADSVGVHQTVAGYEQSPYYFAANVDQRESEHIYDWAFDQEVRTGVIAMTDYDFKDPKSDLPVKSIVHGFLEYSDYERFDYPGLYTESANGESHACCRIEEERAQFEQTYAKSSVCGLQTGALFTLSNHSRQDQNLQYLVTGQTLRLQSNDYFTGGCDGGSDYECSFTAISSKTVFHPLRTTPKPFVHGPQTAVMVGKSGEEIWTNEHGQVKVHFHWHRHGSKDENASCWVRVSHPWAGKDWGAVSIPRIGQKVVVDFREGDPDRPIVTGRIYIGELKAPFPLPAGGVVSGIKSNTHKGKGYNELSMDDTAGKEKVTIHAQYDMDSTVEHFQANAIKNNRTTKVTATVDDSLTVDANRTMHIKGGLAETVDAGHQLNVKDGLTEDIQGERTIKVTGAIDPSSTATTDLHATCAGTYTSDSSLKLQVAGSTIEITPAAITIKVDPSGVSVSGPNISLNG
jgi:type VI secretion system secreted protein VgrG